MHQGAIILTINHIRQAVVDLCRGHKIQVCHGVSSKKDVARPLFSSVVSVMQILMLYVDSIVCIRVKLLADCLQPYLPHGKAAR